MPSNSLLLLPVEVAEHILAVAADNSLVEDLVDNIRLLGEDLAGSTRHLVVGPGGMTRG